MNKSTILVLILVPLAVSLVNGWLNKLVHGVSTYSDKELAAIRNAHYPSWYKVLPVISFLGLALVFALSILFIVKAATTDMVSGLMRSLFAPDAIFFNPQPSAIILSFAIFCMMFFGGLLLLSSWNLLLPARMQAYLSAQERRAVVMKARSGHGLILKIVQAVYAIFLLFAIAAVPFYSSVNETGIDRVSTYPRHSSTPFSQIQSVTVECRIWTDKSERQPVYSVHVGIVASSNGKEIILLANSDGQLPIASTTTAEISDMYKVFENNNVTIVKDTNPACAQTAAEWWKPEAKVQYDAFFAN